MWLTLVHAARECEAAACTALPAARFDAARLLLLCALLGACGRTKGRLASSDGGPEVDRREAGTLDDGSAIEVFLPGPDSALGDGPAMLDGSTIDASAPDADSALSGRPPDIYQGPLCGPPIEPCDELRRESVSNHIVWRNDAPSLALRPGQNEPFILYSEAEGGCFGALAQRSFAGAWDVTPTTGAMCAGALLFDSGGVGWAVFDDGEGGSAGLWEWNDAWLFHELLPASLSGGAHSFARDQGGGLHVAVRLTATAPLFPEGALPQLAGYARRSDVWTAAPVANLPEPYPSSLVLSPAGRAHLAFCGPSSGRGWSAYSVVPPAAAEEVAPCDGLTQVVRLAVTEVNGIEEPHLFFNRVVGSVEDGDQIVHATRRGGVWSLDTLVAGSAGSLCWSPATAGDQHCTVDYIEHWPLAAIAGSEGQVRFLFTTLHRMGERVVTCSQGAVPPVCGWKDVSRQFEGHLEIAWVDGDDIGHATVATSFTASAATMAVDSIGQIHIAAYDKTGYEDSSGSAVRYLVLRPGSRW